MKLFRKKFCLVALGSLLLSQLCLPAQVPTPDPAETSPPERFLIIVETSAVMQKRSENAQRIVGSVIANGLKGQMPAGSTIGLWTFNEQLFAGQVPLQFWTPDNRQRVAGKLAQYLQQQKYERNARLNVVWEAVTNIVANSEHITLLLVTSGSEPVKGTPFDAEIAESFSKNAEQQRKNNMPFLTILRAAKGQFVTFAVNMPPWPLEVPEYPEEFKPVAPPPDPPQPKTVTPPPAPKRSAAALLSPTNVIYLVETSPPVAVVTNVAASEPLPTNTAVAVSEPLRVIPTNAPIPAASVAITPSPVSVTGKSSPAATGTPSVLKTRFSFSIVLLLGVGIGVLLGLLLVFVALLRRARRSPGESLITRSMNQNDR